MNNKFTIPSFLSVVAISGIFTGLIALIYSLHIQGYAMYFPDYMNPRVKEFEILRVIFGGLGFIATTLIIIFIAKSTGDEEKVLETFRKWAVIIFSFYVLIFFIMLCIGVPEGKGVIIPDSTNWFTIKSLHDNAILDLSNVPTLAIAALWIVLFFALNRFLRNSSVCSIGKDPKSEGDNLILSLIYTANKYFVSIAFSLINGLDNVRKCLISKKCFEGIQQIVILILFAIGFFTLKETLSSSGALFLAFISLISVQALFKMTEEQIAKNDDIVSGAIYWAWVVIIPATVISSIVILHTTNYWLAAFVPIGTSIWFTGVIVSAMAEIEEPETIIKEEKGETTGCSEECECSLCTRSDEDEFDDLYGFIEGQGLEAEFDEYQVIRDEERKNRKAW